MKWDFRALYQDLVVCVCVFFKFSSRSLSSMCQHWCECECALTCFTDPLKVSVELPLNLLLSPQLEELAPVLHSLPLFGKFTVGTFVIYFFLLFMERKCKTQIIVGKKTKLNCFCKTNGRLLPWEYTQHQVEHEEGADDDEGDVVHPIKVTATYIVTLQETHGHTSVMHCWFNFPLLFFCRECQLRLF